MTQAHQSPYYKSEIIICGKICIEYNSRSSTEKDLSAEISILITKYPTRSITFFPFSLYHLCHIIHHKTLKLFVYLFATTVSFFRARTLLIYIYILIFYKMPNIVCCKIYFLVKKNSKPEIYLKDTQESSKIECEERKNNLSNGFQVSNKRTLHRRAKR